MKYFVHSWPGNSSILRQNDMGVSAGHEPQKNYFTWLKFGISNRIKKELKLHTVCAVISKAINPLQLVFQVAQFKFESKFGPVQVIWQSLWRLFQKAIEGLEGKINCQALGAALLLCLRGSDWRAQTQGVSESAAVSESAVGRRSTNTERFLVDFHVIQS